MSYDTDRTLEVRFARQIKQILGLCFISQSKYMDQKEATDFAVFYIEPFSVAARLRRYPIYCNLQYRNQFTVRWSRPSGIKTEIHKIREGLVQYLFYGFLNETESHIIQYFVGDLNVLLEANPKHLGPFPNRPPDSELVAYELKSLPPEFFVHKYGL